MKLQVLQENFAKALSNASRFSSAKVQLPVLANVLLKTKRNKLLITATNLEISVALTVGAKITKEGEITVPAKTINEIVSHLPHGQIMLEVDKERLKIKSDNFQSTISGMNSADFPAVPQTIRSDALSLDKEIFTNSLLQTLFAVSTDETRPVLTGLLMVFQKGGIELVATDGFRLSKKRIANSSIKEKGSVILPKSVLSELARLNSENDNDVLLELKTKDKQVVFGMQNVILSSRVIDGEFPNYEKIIPKSSNVVIDVDKEEMIRAVKLASVFAKDAANVVKVTLEKKAIILIAESSQSGRQIAKVDADINEKGDLVKGFEIAFNYRFLEDLLTSVTGSDIQISFSEPNAPGVFLDPKDKDYLHLIMPVRLQS